MFSTRVSDDDTDIAGTGIGLLLLGAGKVSLLNPANGHAVAALRVPGAVILVPGPCAAVVTVSGPTTYLLRLGQVTAGGIDAVTCAGWWPARPARWASAFLG